jgi:hypothetical protein
MNRLAVVASAACALSLVNAPVFACFADPNAQPRRSISEIDLPKRVTPSVVIEISSYTFYIPSAAMDAIVDDTDRVELWPAEIIAGYQAVSPIESNVLAFEFTGLSNDQASIITARDPSAVEIDGPGSPVTDFSSGRMWWNELPLPGRWLAYALANLIDRSEVSILQDGNPLESITRIQYDNVCDGGRLFRHNGATLLEVIDWIS